MVFWYVIFGISVCFVILALACLLVYCISETFGCDFVEFLKNITRFKIVKKPRLKEAKCPVCGCVFRPSFRALSVEYNYRTEGKILSVKCKYCEEKIPAVFEIEPPKEEDS